MSGGVTGLLPSGAAGARQPDVTAADLLLVRGALAAGAGPVEALRSSSAPALAAVVAAVAAGVGLDDVAAGLGADGGAAGGAPEGGTAGQAVDPASHPQVGGAAGTAAAALVRALAVAEDVGAPAGPAVDAVLDGVQATARLHRLIGVRSAQALLSARFLVAMPVVAGLLLALLDAGARDLLGSAAGALLAGLAAGLIVLAVLWMRRLLRTVPGAASATDPLVGRRRGGDGSVPTAEAVDLLALALAGGAPLADACRLVGRVGPPPVRPVLTQAGQRLAAGASPAAALGADLPELGTLVDAAQRWGAPTAAPLRLLAEDLRERAAAAAEEAAERLAVRLVLPTTLLLVPAFGLLAVVPFAVSLLAGTRLGP